MPLFPEALIRIAFAPPAAPRYRVLLDSRRPDGNTGGTPVPCIPTENRGNEGIVKHGRPATHGRARIGNGIGTMRKHIQHVSREPQSVPKFALSIVEGPDLSKTITFEPLERILGFEIPDCVKNIVYY